MNGTASPPDKVSHPSPSIVICSTGHTKVDPHGALIYSISRCSEGNPWYTSVSCAQMSSEHCVCCVCRRLLRRVFWQPRPHFFPRADADRDLAKRQLVQRLYDEILHVRSRPGDPPGARATDQNGRVTFFPEALWYRGCGLFADRFHEDLTMT